MKEKSTRLENQLKTMGGQAGQVAAREKGTSTCRLFVRSRKRPARVDRAYSPSSMPTIVPRSGQDLLSPTPIGGLVYIIPRSNSYLILHTFLLLCCVALVSLSNPGIPGWISSGDSCTGSVRSRPGCHYQIDSDAQAVAYSQS